MTISKAPARALRRILLGSAALGLALWMPQTPWSPAGLTDAAYAQAQGQGGGGSGGGHPGGSSGSGGAGGQHGGGASTSGGGSSHAPGASGQGMGRGGATSTQGHYGQGGSTGTETGEEGTSTDKKGPRFGGGEDTRKPEPGTTGGRPVWAKEGIPEVELGRLSVARAPEHVLDHAFTEVVSNWTTTGTTVMTLTADGQPTLTMTVAQLYSLPAIEFARIVQTYYASIVRIDSPLENLSLLKNLAITNTTALSGVTPASKDDLVAIFLGSASDKTIPVSADTVTAINTILGLPPLTDAQTADIAVKAEAVRAAIDTGHG
jgi:hypothetical protein